MTDQKAANSIVLFPKEMRPLRDIRNEDGFKFIGIDKEGGKHYCHVEKERGKYFMCSNTITFDRLAGWLPAKEMK